MRRSTVHFVLAVAVCALSSLTAFAADTSKPGIALPWEDPATWVDNTVPALGEDVTIAPDSQVLISVATGDVTINTLYIQAGISVGDDAKVTLSGAVTLHVTSDVSMDAFGATAGIEFVDNATLDVDGGIYGNGYIDFDEPSEVVSLRPRVHGAFGGLGGTLTLAGDYSLNGSFDSGEGIVILDGTARQQWVQLTAFTDLTITNSSSNIGGGVYESIQFDDDITVSGTLRLQGGIVNSDGQVHTDNPILRTSGHIIGYHQQAVSTGLSYRMEVGTATDYTPVDLTASAGGAISARANGSRYQNAGPNSLNRHWELFGGAAGATDILFHYVSGDVSGDESTYVAARTDGATWQRYDAPTYTVVRDEPNDHIGATGPAFTLDGYWTAGEPSSVTTATKLAILTINEGALPVRRLTPFDIVIQAQDASGNPAAAPTFTPLSLDVSIGTGVLTDISNTPSPLSGALAGGQIEVTFVDVVYSVQETVTLTVTDTNATPLAGDAEVVAFDAAATALVVTNLENFGRGSLRHAIQTVNLGGCSGVPCHIGFNLPPGLQDVDGTWKILVPGGFVIGEGVDGGLVAHRDLAPTTMTGRIATPLPAITAPVDIDGTSQSGYNPLNPQPLVDISTTHVSSPLFNLQTQNSKVRGLALHGGAQALKLGGTGGHTIEGCYIGLTALGAVANGGNGDTQQGILIESNTNVIGGMNLDNTSSALKRNVISGMISEGVFAEAGTSGNTILGNYIGTNPAGSVSFSNSVGILLQGSSQNTIGGDVTGARNVISGNDSWGIKISADIEFAESATRNEVRGNYIGMAADGIAPLQNTDGGVLIGGDGAAGNIVGGMTASQGNLISGGSVGIATENLSTTSAFFGNRIPNATTLAIDLDNDGVNDANDTGDADVNGSCAPDCVRTNNGQNRPVISRAEVAGTTLETDVTVDSAAVVATASIRVEVFKAFSGRPSQYLGGACFNTNFVNNFTVFLTGTGVTAGDTVVTSATSFNAANCELVDISNTLQLSDGTSELSVPFTVVAGACAPPSVTVTGASAFCTGGSTTLTANPSGGTGPYAYQWYSGVTLLGGETNATLIVTTAGSYKVVVTDNVTCSNESAPFAVSETPSPNATVTAPASVCPNTTGHTASVPTQAGATYAWSAAGGTITSATNLDTITFTAGPTGNVALSVTVTKSGCATNGGANVAISPAPVVNITGPTSSCAGAPITLDAGAGFASYSWNTVPPQSTRFINVSPTADTTYQVTVTDGNTCAANDSHTVTITANPTATMTAPASVCASSAGHAASVPTQAGATYAWTITGGTITSASNIDTITFTAGASGTVALGVSVTANSCTSNGSANVTINPLPVVTITGPASSCPGAPVTLDAGAGFASYLWDTVPPQNTRFITVSPTADTTYSVTVTDGNTCSGSDSHTITVAANPPVAVAAPASVCPGGTGSASVTPQPGATYAWSISGGTITSANNIDSITFKAGGSGSVALNVTVTSGSCSSNGSANVLINTPPSVTITGETSSCAGAPVTLDAGPGFASYQWDTVPPQNTRFITVSPLATTTYKVIVTDGNSCSAFDTHEIAVSSNPTVTINAPGEVVANSVNNANIAPQPGGATIVWTVSNGILLTGQGTNAISFEAGASGSVQLSVSVQVAACSSSGNTTIPIVQPDGANLSLDKNGPESVETGETFDYTITVHNDGPETANVVVHDTLPNGVTFVSVAVTFGGWPCSGNDAGASCSGVLSSGSTQIITIRVTAPSQPATLINTAEAVLSNTIDPDPSNNSDSVQTMVIAPLTCAATPPSLLAPANNASVLSPVSFSWTAVAGAVAYELWITDGSTATLAGTTSSTSLSVPVASGIKTWHVTAQLPAGCEPLTSETRTFNVTPSANCGEHGAPQITAPSEGSTHATPVTISWTAVPQAIGYRVWISEDGGALQDIGTTDGATSLTIAAPAGSITIFVDALFGGCPPTRSAAVHFTVPDDDACAGRGAATPTSPANDATLGSSQVDFHWNPAPNADGYRLWAAIDGAAAEVLGETDDTTLRIKVDAGEAIWWIESLYDGCASTESARRRFVLPPRDNCGTARPELVAPADDSTRTATQVTFTWLSVADLAGYEVWLALNNGTFTLLATTGPETTSVTHEVPAGTLQWFVRVLVDRCPSRDSQTRDFTVTSLAACEDNQRPVLSTPADGDEVSAPVDFLYSTVDGATRYEIYAARGTGAPSLVAMSETGEAADVNLPAGTTRWFVRAFFGEGCPSLDSSEATFNVVPRPEACTPLTPPVIAAPGQISAGSIFRLQWTPEPAATQYQLQLASNADFSDASLITTTATASDVTGPANGTVFARVRAIDTRCTPSPTVSAYGPVSAILILPSQGAAGAADITHGGILEYSIVLGSEYAGQSFTATSQNDFITITPAAGVVPAGGITLIVAADTSTLPVGATIAGITISLSGPTLSSNATSVSIPISVNLVTPITPAPKNAPPPDALIIPAVANAAGINAQFQSDVRVSNTSPQPIKYQLTFIPTGEAGISSGRQTTFTVDAGRTIALDDVLKGWFGTGTQNAVGSLEIRPLSKTQTTTSSAAVGALANIVSFASSRTFNVTPTGTFGQYIPAIPFANFLGKAANAATKNVLSLQQISQSDKFRTNLGLVEGSGERAELLIKVFGSNGQQLTSFPVTLNGGQHTQLNAFLFDKGITLNDGRVEVEVVSGSGKITAYASVLDNATSDAVLVTPVTLSDTGNTKWVVPGVADVATGFANWKTDMRVFNAGATTAEVTASFYSQNGGAPKTAQLSIPPGEVRQLDKVLPTLFNVTGDGGAVHLDSATSARLIATARTYNETSTGSYGLFASAVTPQEAVGVGSRPLQLLQVEESSRYRSNIGFAEVTGKPVTLEVTVIPPDVKFAAIVQVPLAANEFRQIGAMLAGLGIGEVYNARISVRAIEGAGRATAYAAVIDMKTNDPTYVPAQ